MKIPFLSFDSVNEQLRQKMSAAFSQVYESKWYVLGEQVRGFETEYAGFNDVNHCVGISNGLDALFLCLKALGVGKGDEVIVPSNTYIASWLAVSYTGALPVPVEPNESTFNIEAAGVEQQITPRTKVIMPVHLYGQCCEMEPLLDLAKRRRLFIVEDNAQAQGATCNGRAAGTMGVLNATSFYPGKNLGALGDAGAVTSQDEELAKKVRIMRNYGSERKYYNEVMGFNMRLDEMQAAFLRVKLAHLREWNLERQRLARMYDERLAGVPGLCLPRTANNCTHVYHLYVVRTKKRNELQKYLEDKGVGTMIHYPVPPHLQKAYAGLGYVKGRFPIAESMADTCLSLPLYPGLNEDKLDFICHCIHQFFKIA